MEVSGDPGSQKAKIVIDDSTSIDIKGSFTANLTSLSFPETPKAKVNIRLSGWTTDSGWKGTGQLVDGTWIDWVANRTGDLANQDNAEFPDT